VHVSVDASFKAIWPSRDGRCCDPGFQTPVIFLNVHAKRGALKNNDRDRVEGPPASGSPAGSEGQFDKSSLFGHNNQTTTLIGHFQPPCNIARVGPMHRYSQLVVSLLFVVIPITLHSQAQDTSRLSAHLKALRGKQLLTSDEYRSIQGEYLTWIDSRIKLDRDTESMNRELEAAGVFPKWSKAPDQPDFLADTYASHAGYVDPISSRAVRSDVFAIVAGMYQGIGCSRDVAAILYQRQPVKRLATLNGEPAESPYAYYLSGIATGDAGPTGERMFASGWVVSNCTSTWNGKRIRIDRLKGSAITAILVRDLDAKDREEGEAVSADVEGNVATFRYDGATGDGELLVGPSIARYQVVGGRAVLESPVALTRAGFIHEWLGMSLGDATRWSEPQAVAARSVVVSALSHGFQWQRIARCGGVPSVWEIAVRPNGSTTLQVFRIAGASASELRMLAVVNTVTESCVPDDLSGLAEVAPELPR